jgi:hypothetical protein
MPCVVSCYRLHVGFSKNMLAILNLQQDVMSLLMINRTEIIVQISHARSKHYLSDCKLSGNVSEATLTSCYMRLVGVQDLTL